MLARIQRSLHGRRVSGAEDQGQARRHVARGRTRSARGRRGRRVCVHVLRVNGLARQP